jgi:hypothetical protein
LEAQVSAPKINCHPERFDFLGSFPATDQRVPHISRSLRDVGNADLNPLCRPK